MFSCFRMLISAICRQARYLYTLSPPAPQGYLEVRTKARKKNLATENHGRKPETFGKTPSYIIKIGNITMDNIPI